jgi:hypothetical protein
MSHSEFAIAGFYDHEQEFEPRAPDWGGDAVFSPAVAGGRRTVTITGRPEGAPPAPRPAVTDRRRPPRTVSDRVGPRPDRVAGWAFGMGILLIVVAAFS